jgi:hypothetical protein
LTKTCGPIFTWELAVKERNVGGGGTPANLAASPAISLDGEVADDLRLPEAVLEMFLSTSSASWICGYGRMERRWRR